MSKEKRECLFVLVSSLETTIGSNPNLAEKFEVSHDKHSKGERVREKRVNRDGEH
jgi:hypothetical protein